MPGFYAINTYNLSQRKFGNNSSQLCPSRKTYFSIIRASEFCICYQNYEVVWKLENGAPLLTYSHDCYCEGLNCGAKPKSFHVEGTEKINVWEN